LPTFCYCKDLNNLVKYLQQYFMYSSICLDPVYKMSMIHTSNTCLRKFFPPRENNLRALKTFKLSWVGIGQIVFSTRFCIYIYISKNLCTYLIKQLNNYLYKVMKKNSLITNKNKIEKIKRKMKIKIPKNLIFNYVLTQNT
jgi:hypothetical protein